MKKIKYNKNKKKYGNKSRINIKIMSDYCADGIWWNGGAITIYELPQSVHYLNKRIDNWQYTFEKFRLYNKNKFQSKVLENSKLYKDWLNEGLLIAIEIRNKLGSKFEVEYFKEDTNKTIFIDKKLNLYLMDSSHLNKKYAWNFFR